MLAPFDGLTHQTVGWRIGSRGANPPSRRSTHQMGRSGQVRSDTQRRAGEPIAQAIGGRLAPFDGLTHQTVGWPTGSRGANPPARRSTHQMGRSGQVRSDTQRRAGTGTRGLRQEPGGSDQNQWAGTGTGGLGPEPVGWDRNRWARTRTSGLGQEPVGSDRYRWGGTRNSLSQPTTTCPRSPDVDRSAQHEPAGTTPPSLGTPPPRPASARPPPRPASAPGPASARPRSRRAHPGRRSPTQRAGEPETPVSGEL